MSENRLFARALPSAVHLTEEYEYDIHISGNPSVQPIGQAQGAVELTVAYDGHMSFGRRAMDDVKAKVEKATGDLEAHIGHLALANIGRTDLKSALDLGASTTGLPILVPVRHESSGLTTAAHLRDDRHICVLRQEYHPEWPESVLLQVRMELLDESTLREAVQSASSIGQPAGILNLVSQESGFKESLWLMINVQLDLPERLISGETEADEKKPVVSVANKSDSPTAPQPAQAGPPFPSPPTQAPDSPGASGQAGTAPVAASPEAQPAPATPGSAPPAEGMPAAPSPAQSMTRHAVLVGQRAEARPRITRMSLRWPAAISHRNVQLLVSGSANAQPARYDPGRGVIEWGDIPLNYAGKAEGADLYSFCAPPMTLLINQPGELYRVDKLLGSVEVDLPDVLLSGVQAQYFDAQGAARTKEVLTAKTTFRARLTLIPEERFRRRVYAPYQRLEFASVVLDELRLADIHTVLQENGFHNIRRSQISTGENQVIFDIEGARVEGLDSLNLRVIAIGTYINVERRTEIPGGRTFVTPIRSGDTVIHLYGELRSNNGRLSRVLNDIHRALKARFDHVAVE